MDDFKNEGGISSDPTPDLSLSVLRKSKISYSEMYPVIKLRIISIKSRSSD